LAVIKNPPQLSFVRQANIGHAVQVNNGMPMAAPASAGENENHPSKLLEAPHVERLDSRTASTSIGTNPPREAVGVVNGTKNGPGKGTRRAELVQGRNEEEATRDA
jgi:hypothetical protein